MKKSLLYYIIKREVRFENGVCKKERKQHAEPPKRNLLPPIGGYRWADSSRPNRPRAEGIVGSCSTGCASATRIGMAVRRRSLQLWSAQNGMVGYFPSTLHHRPRRAAVNSRCIVIALLRKLRLGSGFRQYEADKHHFFGARDVPWS